MKQVTDEATQVKWVHSAVLRQVVWQEVNVEAATFESD
jgi:hypothetical protein